LALFSSGFGLALLKSSLQPVKLSDVTKAPSAKATRPLLDAARVGGIEVGLLSDSGRTETTRYFTTELVLHKAMIK
jgi:hypothetical protein